MGLRQLLIVTTILFELFALSFACSRRRSPSCTTRDCTYKNWGPWSTCTAKCGSVGLKTRTRKIQTKASCGGTCDNKFREEVPCPNTCCPIDCDYEWLAWSPCDVTCGYGKRTRNMRVISKERCGGKACPSQRNEQGKCGDGR